MSEIKYIAESGEFIIDGKVVKESTLTEQERKQLMEQSKKVQLIVGETTNSGQVII